MVAVGLELGRNSRNRGKQGVEVAVSRLAWLPYRRGVARTWRERGRAGETRHELAKGDSSKIIRRGRWARVKPRRRSGENSGGRLMSTAPPRRQKHQVTDKRG